MLKENIDRTQNRVAVIQGDIMFDHHLKMLVQKKKNVEPDEKNATYYILRAIQALAVLLFIFAIPITQQPQWCVEQYKDDNWAYKDLDQKFIVDC